MPQTAKRPSHTSRLDNYMEELTDSILEGLILEYKGSHFSEDSINDIKALALNRLWPMYATSTAGKDFLKRSVVEDQVEHDVIRELRVAIDIVRSNPRR